jgi:hypothetical protein
MITCAARERLFGIQLLIIHESLPKIITLLSSEEIGIDRDSDLLDASMHAVVTNAVHRIKNAPASHNK